LKSILPYDPGVLPTRPAPNAGESIIIEVAGLPPIKTIGRSLRNRSHPRYFAFSALRASAIQVMAGRAWYFGNVELALAVYSAEHMGQDTLLGYVAGIMDSLDGSAGPTFTYLPVVFQDDSQVRGFHSTHQHSEQEHYRVEVAFK
jgi:hypothetical protein